LHDLSQHIGHSNLPSLIRHFLCSQLGSDTNCNFSGKVHVFHAAVATFYAPSDSSGIGGMHQEWIRAVPSWHRGPARNDCVFVETDADGAGFRGLHVGHVLLFFSFSYMAVYYPCALVQWFVPIQDQPCNDSGMWMVKPEFHLQTGKRERSVIHLDSVLRGAHLMPIYGNDFLPRDFHFADTLHAFQAYFVNKFIDHHAFEIAF
jgi:hypothetical protein